METDFSIVEGAYLRDILDQPRALDQTLVGLKVSESLHRLANRLREGEFKAVVLTGMGSSFHALHPLNIHQIHHGIPPIVLETSELVHYGNRLFDPKTLVIAVSQSGQSAEVVRLLEVNRQRSPVIAVTNTAASPLAEQADATILSQAGQEFSVSCKTYVTALMALRWLGDVICGCDLEQTREELALAGSAAREYLVRWKDHVQHLAQMLKGTRHLFLVGRGASLAAVGTGALIIKESDHFHAEGMSSAAFRHGPLEMLSQETFVLVFAGADKTRELNQKLLDDIREERGRAELIGKAASFPSLALSEAPEAIHPILEILPVQMVTLALAAQIGREPGRFVLASKVTTRE